MSWEHKGHTIEVTSWGQFESKIGEQTFREASLGALHVVIDREVTKGKTKREAFSTPCFVAAGGAYKKAAYRGLHTGTNDVLVTLNGKKRSVKRYGIYKIPVINNFQEKFEDYRKAQDVVDAFEIFMRKHHIEIPYLRGQDTVEQISVKEKEVNDKLLSTKRSPTSFDVV
jgi:hypothetical protein